MIDMIDSRCSAFSEFIDFFCVSLVVFRFSFYCLHVLC